MYQKVLLCYDGTIEGRRALRQGAEVAIAMRSQAYLLAICRNMLAGAIPEAVTPELFTCQSDTAQALLKEGIEWLREREVVSEGSLIYGDPLVRIPEIAIQIKADLVVVGYRYRSKLSRWWSESEEISLLHRLPCSLLVAVAAPTE
ncbi:MAG: universal stress protein [Povalibacter sp.]|jgi:nucleotide-binding universal stress UspA family protein